VVEVFIAPKVGEAPVHHYVEIELSPNSVLFASNITNPDLTCQVLLLILHDLLLNLFQMIGDIGSIHSV